MPKGIIFEIIAWEIINFNNFIIGSFVDSEFPLRSLEVFVKSLIIHDGKTKMFY